MEFLDAPNFYRLISVADGAGSCDTSWGQVNNSWRLGIDFIVVTCGVDVSKVKINFGSDTCTACTCD
jgi:hypothetical protein